jgi:NAD(P)H-hydrate epimerase
MKKISALWALPSDARSRQALLTAEAARAVDRAAIAAGTPEATLMERAGAAVAAEIQARWKPLPVLVIAGPGNNGGDGFVVARVLADAGWPVRVVSWGDDAKRKGSGAKAAARWLGAVHPLDGSAFDGVGLVVDALFGTGLARPLDGALREIVESLNRLALPVVAVDIASGVETDSGAVLGAAIRAKLTVTFFRRKLAHLLLPGRDLAGEVVVADLGVAEDVFAAVPVDVFANEPDLWRDAFPWPTAEGHKYTRGHALVLGGAKLTGAARLAAHASARMGAGLVTIAAKPSVVPIYAAWRADLMIARISSREDFRALLNDKRVNAVLLGPGAGADRRLSDAIAAALDAKVGLVLDADCFRVLAGPAKALVKRLNARVLMTPHEGEFTRLFGSAAPRLPAALKAARETGATILLKGSDTVIAGPDGKAIINADAPPDLATAGSGDVLAGLALGMVANHLPPLLAGAVACWVHGRAAALFGPGLVAEDIADMVPDVLRLLKD